MNPSGDIAGEGAAAAQEAAPGATGAPSDALHELRDAMRQFAAERAWAGRPSASARATVAGASAPKAAASHLMIEVRLMKS